MVNKAFIRGWVLGLTLMLMSAPAAHAGDIRFSGGAPLDTYQPRIIVPLLTEAFKRAGHSFKAIHYPSLRSLKSSNSGKTDGELHRVYDFHRVSKGKYPNLVRIESELIRIATGIFTGAPNAVIGDLQGLTGRRVAFKSGRLKITNQLKKLPSSTHLFPVGSDVTAIRMLAKRRVEFVVMEFNEGNAIIKNNPKYQNIHSAARVGERRIFAYMNKRHAQMAKIITVELEKMKSEGVFANLVAKSIKEFGALLTGVDK